MRKAVEEKEEKEAVEEARRLSRDGSGMRAHA
jgi:hypothetical protein